MNKATSEQTGGWDPPLTVLGCNRRRGHTAERGPGQLGERRTTHGAERTKTPPQPPEMGG